MTCFIWRILDLIVKYGKIQGEAKTNGVGWCHFGFTNLQSWLVCLLGIVNNFYDNENKRQLNPDNECDNEKQWTTPASCLIEINPTPNWNKVMTQ